MSQSSYRPRLTAAVAFASLAAACSETDFETSGVRGVLRSATADYFAEGRVEKLYGLLLDDGSTVPLKFSVPPRISAGTEIRVFGDRRAEDVSVSRVEVLEPDSDFALSRADNFSPPTPLTPPLKVAFVSLTPTYNKATLDKRMQDPDFIKQVLDVSSYGRWTMEFDAFGPYSVANDCGGSFYDNLGRNGENAMKAAGVDTSKYDQIQFIVPQNFCSWGGFGHDGKTPYRSDGKRGMYNRWSYVKDLSEGVDVQEIGHNWGLMHVHFCPGTATPSKSCSGYSEYGSPYSSPMSTGNNVYLNAWERIQLNFFTGCNVITVGASGMYEIAPLAKACTGPQVIRVAADKAGDIQRYFYIEYRVPIGIEKTNGVLVHYSADMKKGGWNTCDYGGPDCPEQWHVNVKGGAVRDAVHGAGTEWTTPQGVKVKIVSTAATAKLDITLPAGMTGGSTICMNDTPYAGTAPNCSGTGTGTGGAGGTPGTGGMGGGGAGTGGRGGVGGGTSGSGGRTGTGGDTTGTGGSGTGGDTAGTGGTTGSGGSTVTGTGGSGDTGTGGSTGSGGSDTTGTGGTTTGTGGRAGTGGRGTGGGSDEGCGCRVADDGAGSAFSTLAFAAVFGALAHNRSRSRGRSRCRSRRPSRRP